MLQFTLGLVLSFSVVSAWASNGWVSSGGDLYHADKNPWFLRNTPEVHYCLKIDSAGISIHSAQVRAHIKTAFDFWHKELKDLSPVSGNGKTTLGIGAQKFIEIPCNGKEELRFVIGAGVLTSAQRRLLKDPQRHLGVAVRTNYDPVQLRGRGFIFIGSDRGPEKLRSSVPVATLWDQKNLMAATLVHELGHVFGLPHFGSGVMSEAFAEKIASSAFFLTLVNMPELPSLLRPPASTESCGVEKEILEFFEASNLLPDEKPENLCLVLESDHVRNSLGTGYYWKLGLRGKLSAETKPVGELSVDLESVLRNRPLDWNMNVISLVHLNPRQRVFAEKEKMSYADPRDPSGQRRVVLEYFFGAFEFRYGLSTTLKLTNAGQARAVYLHAAPEGFKLFAAMGGQNRLIFRSDRLWFF